jgi:prepilin signal peptidase PulO-like enzyme (type II secretory pathway)
MLALESMVYIFLIIFGLCFGSFINALVWRIHCQESENRSQKIGEKKQKNHPNSQLLTPNYSVLKGRSMCPNCKHQLGFWDLIPVISWLSLKGRCRYCNKPISIQYPVVELTTTIVFVLSYLFWPYGFDTPYLYVYFITWLVVIIGLIALAVYDIKWMILPDKIVWPLTVIVLISFIIQIFTGRPYADIPQVALAGVIGGGIFWILFQISGGKWIGGGDVKLGFLIGLILVQPQLVILQLFIASLLGTLFALPFLVSKKLKASSKIPFGPFLIASAIIVMLFGQQIIETYLDLLLV